MIMGFASYLGTASSILAEAKEIWYGLFFAKDLGITNLWIESDSEILVKCLNEDSTPPWSIEYIYNDIASYIKLLISCMVTHILREGNEPAIF